MNFELTLTQLTELFIKRYMEVMEVERDWATEVQGMECTNPHDVSDVELTISSLCSLCGVPYLRPSSAHIASLIA